MEHSLQKHIRDIYISIMILGRKYILYHSSFTSKREKKEVKKHGKEIRGSES